MLLLKSKLKNEPINLATDIKEITPDALSALLVDVKLPKFYCVVALCFNVKLADIAINIAGAKDATVSVLPLLAKVGEEELERMNAAIGDKIIIDRTSLERGHQLHIKTVASSEYVKGFIRDDEELRQNLIKGGDGSDKPIPFISNLSKKERDEALASKSPTVFVLSFKIVPVNDIVGSLPIVATAIDPFKVVTKELVN